MLTKQEQDDLFHKLSEELANNEAQQDAAGQVQSFRYNALSSNSTKVNSSIKEQENASKRNIQH